jgi:hypothetical protein
LQSQMQPIGRGVRAYFAPVDRVNGIPAVFDPSCAFDLEEPPAPWIELGEVEKFARTPQTSVSAVKTGEFGTVAAQYRAALDAKVECEFLNWGKLQMALAGGSVHYNVLAGVGAAPQPCGGAAVLAKTLLMGSTSTQLLLSIEDLAQFEAGDLVAVDVDYRGESGYVGTGIAAAYVEQNGDVMRGMDYTRRVTFNIGVVKTKTATGLVLDRALPGGDPAVNAAVQKVAGFVDREGGSFFQEWSAVFVMPEDSGGRIFFYYPRLQVLGGASEGEKELSSPIVGRTLKASFRALAVRDLVDGEMCVCWRSYLPGTAY